MRLHSALLALTLAPTIAFAEDCAGITIHDLNHKGPPASSWPTPPVAGDFLQIPGERHFVELGGFHFFLASTNATGTELWRTDGTTAGTTLVKDINPGEADGNLRGLIAHDGRLWFFAMDPGTGMELWSSDGTDAGTNLVRDIRPGPNPSMGSDPLERLIVGIGSEVFFCASDGARGHELWRSDGTAAGTTLAVDVAPGPESGARPSLVLEPSGTSFVFLGATPGSGYELWRSDGTSAGTYLLADTSPGAETPRPEQIVSRLGQIFFHANDNLWRSDGTPAGTIQLSSFTSWPGGGFESNLLDSAELGGRLYYPASYDVGWEVYSTDGTVAGTYQYLNLETAPVTPLGGSSYPGEFLSHKGFVYFAGTVGTVRKLYRTNGSWGNTQPVTTGGLGFSTTKFHNLVVHNDAVHFTRHTISGWELWKTDGSLAGTMSVEVNPAWVDHLVPGPGGSLLYSSHDSTTGTELYRTLGDGSGGSLLADLATAGQTNDANPIVLARPDGDRLVMVADQGGPGRDLILFDPDLGTTTLVAGPADASWTTPSTTAWLGGTQVALFVAELAPGHSALWRTDGTPSGTFPVSDNGLDGFLDPGPLFYHPPAGAVYFRGRKPGAPHELWISDGTPSGTHELVDINPIGASAPDDFVSLGANLLFSAEGPAGRELWISDGTAAGTSMLVDINPTGNANPDRLTRAGNLVYFVATDGVHGLEPWCTDGTAAGTFMLADLNAGPVGSIEIPGPFDNGFPQGFRAFDGKVVFNAKTPATGKEPHISDGTTAGTVLLADLRPGPGSSHCLGFTRFQDAVHFVDGPAWSERRLYRSDLTVGGTSLVAPIGNTDGLKDSPYTQAVAHADRLYLPLDELYVSDGTGPGTGLLIPPDADTGPSYPSKLVAANDGVYFSAFTTLGRELYHTDGTQAGTQLVCDIYSGYLSSNPTDLTLVGGRLVLRADTTFQGVELLVLEDPGAHTVDLGQGAGGLQLVASMPLLGQNVSVDVGGASVGSLGFLLLSGQAGAGAHPLLAPGNVSWLHQPSAIPLAVVPATPWNASFPVPAAPVLAGLTFNLQAWFLPGGAFPATSSNGVMLVLGS